MRILLIVVLTLWALPVGADSLPEASDAKAECERQSGPLGSNWKAEETATALRASLQALDEEERAGIAKIAAYPREAREVAQRLYSQEIGYRRSSLKKSLADLAKEREAAIASREAEIGACVARLEAHAVLQLSAAKRDLIAAALAQRYALEFASAGACAQDIHAASEANRIAVAKEEIRAQREGARHSGFVDRAAMHEAGLEIADATRTIAEYKQAAAVLRRDISKRLKKSAKPCGNKAVAAIAGCVAGESSCGEHVLAIYEVVSQMPPPVALQEREASLRQSLPASAVLEADAFIASFETALKGDSESVADLGSTRSAASLSQTRDAASRGH